MTGLLVPPHNAGALAEAILRLLTDESLRHRMGEAGLAPVRERFNVERMVDETLAVYARVAGRPRAAGNGDPRRRPEAAEPCHPEVTQREVVLAGSAGSICLSDAVIDAAMRHPGNATRQAEALPHSDDVHVERDDEARR